MTVLATGVLMTSGPLGSAQPSAQDLEAQQSFIKPVLDAPPSPPPPLHRSPPLPAQPRGAGLRRRSSSGVIWYWPLPSRESPGLCEGPAGRGEALMYKALSEGAVSR